MPRKLPLHVERNHVKGHTYLYFRRGKGPRIRLPSDPNSMEFREAYAAAMGGRSAPKVPRHDLQGTIGALIASYMRSAQFIGLRTTSKKGYLTRLEQIRVDHGHRAVAGLSRDRINTLILAPYADRPGARLDVLKKLRILIAHAIEKDWLKYDPSIGIKRPKSKPVRRWHPSEMASFEARWPLGTKQRTAYELMRNVGTARVDVHKMTWTQIDADAVQYTRSKSGEHVDIGMSKALKAALNATARKHVVIITTEFGRPYTVDGFSGFMRDAMKAAGLPLDCKPHGLRKTLGNELADAEVSTHGIQAALGHTTLEQAHNYTRESNRSRGARRAIEQLDDHRENRNSQTTFERLGKVVKTKGTSEW
jgi:enterobacteria phage integrase